MSDKFIFEAYCDDDHSYCTAYTHFPFEFVGDIFSIIRDDLISQIDGDKEINKLDDYKNHNHKKYWRVEVEVIDGELVITRTNAGFNSIELIGLCELEIRRYSGIKRFGMKVKHVRNYVSNE